MKWHIINHKDYIEGPFDTFDAAVNQAYYLGNETRPEPRLRRKANDFFIYKAPYDHKEHWQPEYWIVTREAAMGAGVSEELFLQPLTDSWA